MMALAVSAGGAMAQEAGSARVCSVHDRTSCYPTPQQYDIGPDVRLTIEGRPAGAEQALPGELHSIADLFAALRHCWRPPHATVSRKDMQIAVRVSFKSNGEVVGEPRLTFSSPDVLPETRHVYLKAVHETLARCAPLKFTKEFAGAIAGRPVAVRFRDNREVEPVQARSERP
jgi:hypothetical protein